MYNVAIVGATGNVGRKFLEILAERNFPIKNLYLYASKRSAGKKMTFKGNEYTVIETCKENIEDKELDFALFSAGGDTSLEFAPIFSKTGAVVIDNSSAWRMDPKVPLVVPEVNPEDIKWHNGIIANPNCSTIQAMPVLKAIDDAYGLKRVIYSTYQAVSGAGMQGIKDLEDGLKGVEPKKFPYPIAGNCLPHIDVFLENGYTKEEMKMIEETRKILHNPDLKITATTVRVPVLNSHSESINLELNKEFEVSDIISLLNTAKGVVVYDNIEELKYPTPLSVTGKDEVYVGRIRRDFSIDNGLNLWVVADNIRKGAALNAVQIAELMINK
ncbi:aspartate-semialdehyde dehydrogenase [Clostridium thermobutyricum]|uniref:Aspartate-semialdehyde dehydrogenase n=1 Tax=Clostridium thermobutyricum DSM 4928 TaxID=1121339 RepID=A0A1V4SWJ9_9CLOT|nr:aspartate-semialdehyde dehydrogenase [Clostridium thermobutyricum]OPX47987.1 aspartate-semialdehyde dehydrogenase [Clostridium thermobutyricum DSM 4928]